MANDRVNLAPEQGLW